MSAVGALRQPAAVSPLFPSSRPVDVAVHRVHDGRVTSGTVRSRLPECVTSTRFSAGPVMPHRSAVLVELAKTVTRCAPWLRVYVGPRLWSECAASDADSYACRAVVRFLTDGRVEYEHRGVACWDHDVVLVAAADRLPAVMDTLHHEVWHAVERMHLAASDVDYVTWAVGRGLPQPGQYLASMVERRARLYAAWSIACDEGWRPMCILGRPVRRLDRVLGYVYSGALANDVTAGRSARCQRSRLRTVGIWLHWCLLQSESAPYPL